jgi:arylsulfatase A-like enzyme
MDRLAREGAHLKNAFVTTSLCSPSRASILTGQYAHTHTVVDNAAPAPDHLLYFPQYLQQVGYQTGFFGKWHMGGDNDDPRPGFNQWVSFRGQGVYYNPKLNINGKHVQYTDSAYISEVLTDQALDWLKQRKKDSPSLCTCRTRLFIRGLSRPEKTGAATGISRSSIRSQCS